MKLHTILRYLGVSTGNMEEGSFRCDANISIRPEGSKRIQLAKVEVKNMNSFRAVFQALEYEAERQRKAAPKAHTRAGNARLAGRKGAGFLAGSAGITSPSLSTISADCDVVVVAGN